MTEKNKKIIFEILLKELKSNKNKTVIEVVKKFNQSNFKGLPRLNNFMLIDDVLGERL